MQAEKKLEVKAQRKPKKRLLKSILLLFVVLIILAFLLIPVFVSSEKGRKIILAKINNAIDGTANFASLSMGWLKGIKVTDFSFNDTAGQTSVAVKQIATHPHYASILFGDVSLGKTVIDEPKIKIDLKDWQPEKTPASTGKEPVPIALPISKVDLEVKNGSLKVTDPKAGTVEIAQINSKLNLRPLGEQTDFDMSFIVAKEDKVSKITTEGKIKSSDKKGWTFKGTTGNLTVDVNDLDLGSLAPLLTWAGVDVDAQGRVSANIKSQIKDGKFEKLSGTVNAEGLDVAAGKLKGDRLKTNILDIDVELTSNKDLINIDKLQIQADWLKTQATGVVPTTFKSLADFVKADSKYDLQGTFDCDLAALLSQMPNTVGLKEGMKITSGKLTGSVATETKADKRKVTGNAILDGLKGTIDGKDITLQQPIKADAEISAEKDSVVFDKVGITASFGRFDCSGTTESLQYTCDIDLSAFQSQLGQFVDMGKYQFAGQLSEKATISTKEKQITATGSSTIKNLSVTSKDGPSVSEPQADIDFAVGYNRENGIVSIDSIKTTASLGQVNIKDAVIPTGKKAEKGMELTVSAKVDLAKAIPYAVMFASFPKDMQLAGLAESQLSIISKKDTYTIKTDSTKIQNIKLTSPGKQPFIQNQVLFNFDGDYNPTEQNWTIRKLELLSPDIKIKGDFSKAATSGKTKLQGQAQLEYDWSSLGNLVSAFLPQGLTIQGKRKNTIDFSSEYPTGQPDKLLANLNSSGKLGFEKAEYMGLNLGQTEVDIQIENGLLKIAPFSTTVNDGKLNFAANIDLNEKPMVLRTTGPMQIIDKIKINDRVSDNLLVYLNPIFVNQANVTGIANFHCEKLSIPLQGAANDELEVVGTVGIEQMHLRTMSLLGLIMSKVDIPQDVNLAVLPTKFELKKDVLSYGDMQINVDKYPLNFSGAIGPTIKSAVTARADKKLDMTITTPYIVTSEAKLRTVKIGEVTSRERISLPLKGTLYRPDLPFDKVVEEILKRLLQEQLRDRILEGLDKLLK